MRKFRRFLIISMSALLMCSGLFGCADNTHKKSSENTVETDSVNTETSVDVPEKEDQEDTYFEQLPKVKYINKLTGLEEDEDLSDIRPVAIMINNIKVATPQHGISHADIMYEVLAEGGITRLLCLFTHYKDLPETGSVRSARDYYIDLSDAHDAIYVHCGTSPLADETLKARKTDHIDGIYFSTPFYRNKDRWNKMGKEHSLMTTGEGLVKGIEQKKYRTTSDFTQPLIFSENDICLSGETANYVKLVFSYYQTVELEYDAVAGVYMKKQYSTPHIDANTQEQLSFENAIILYCKQGQIPGDEAGRLYVDFVGEGDGYYINDGAYESIKWQKASRTSSYTLLKQDGITPLELDAGKTYIAIAPIGAKTEFE